MGDRINSNLKTINQGPIIHLSSTPAAALLLMHQSRLTVISIDMGPSEVLLARFNSICGNASLYNRHVYHSLNWVSLEAYLVMLPLTHIL